MAQSSEPASEPEPKTEPEPGLDDTAPAPARLGPHTPRPTDRASLPSADATPLPYADTGARSAPTGASSLPAAAATSSEVLPFQTWERYRILSFLGAGGMGTVYKARDPKLNRYVAIKFLRTSHADLQNSRERRHFEREARAQAALEHPHICKIYEVGEVDGQPYIAMQYIAGSSLSGLSQVLSVPDKLRVVQQVAEALAVAHRQNLIHRDLKPGNILVERRADGSYWPYLMDFGLAREVDSNTQTSTGGVEGTPAYMAPEQARGETRALDRRTDVYGLGATLYGVLSGRPPFVGSSTDVLMAVLLDDPPRLRTLVPALPKDVEIVVHKCLEKEPARRYPTAEALTEDLGRLVSGDTILARPPGLWRRTSLFARRHKLLVVGLATALLATLILGSFALRIRLQAAEQARLAQRLGQEIEKMEWLLRSARQLPLHDLNREKDLVRARMAALQSELSQYGERSRGLAYYALGRGHLALHEYPESLTALTQAQRLGVGSAELHYALGLVLGKHFEAEIARSRLAGGGDWAKKQLQAFEPKYLWPAIASLQRSRALKSDAPEYLEALIAFYQRDYERALDRAAAALRSAPWLYEALKLAGDVHLERALATRDRGAYEEAEKEFNAAISSYQSAAAIGASDAGIYDDLSEAWLRLAQTNIDLSQNIDKEYESFISITSKSQSADTKSHIADLKISTMTVVANKVDIGRYNVKQVLAGHLSCQRYLRANPGDPYASELMASIMRIQAEIRILEGADPVPLLQEAAEILEPVLVRHPNFLWGYNDLGVIYSIIGMSMLSSGNHFAKKFLDLSHSKFKKASELDPEYETSYINIIFLLFPLAELCTNFECIDQIQKTTLENNSKCFSINASSVNCHDNSGIAYAHIALRLLQAGEDPRAALQTALDYLKRARELGGKLLDAEQHVALANWVRARAQVERGEDPAAALRDMEAALTTCLEIAADDAMCRTLQARADWVRADWAAAGATGTGATAQVRGALESARGKAQRATQSKEKYPDAWQTLAETQRRLAALDSADPRRREAAIQAGLAALQPALAINPHHAGSLVTRGELHLLRATMAGLPEARRLAAQAAVESLAQAMEHDPLIKKRTEPRRQKAQGVLDALRPAAPTTGRASIPSAR